MSTPVQTVPGRRRCLPPDDRSPVDSYLIRPAVPADVDALEEIEYRMFDAAVYDRLSRREFERFVSRANVRLLVADANGTVAGYALAVIVNRRALWFNSLAVLTEFQSSGIAVSLFKAVEATQLELGLETVILEIREDNRALLRRYQRMGYCIWKTLPRYYPDGCAALRMLRGAAATPTSATG